MQPDEGLSAQDLLSLSIPHSRWPDCMLPLTCQKALAQALREYRTWPKPSMTTWVSVWVWVLEWE